MDVKEPVAGARFLCSQRSRTESVVAADHERVGMSEKLTVTLVAASFGLKRATAAPPSAVGRIHACPGKRVLVSGTMRMLEKPDVSL